MELADEAICAADRCRTADLVGRIERHIDRQVRLAGCEAVLLICRALEVVPNQLLDETEIFRSSNRIIVTPRLATQGLGPPAVMGSGLVEPVGSPLNAAIT